MFCDIKKILVPALIICFPVYLLAQETVNGVSKGIGGKINFNEMARYEKANPPKLKFKMPAEETEDEITIGNIVDTNTIKFHGIITNINPPKIMNKANEPEVASCVNFNAINDTVSTIPPDVNGAIGFDHLMTTLNTQVRVQKKQGDIISTTTLTGFWNGLGGHIDIFDPKITYDPYDKRWFFVCCASRQSANSALLLAVSQTYDPTGFWNTYTIDADPADLFWFDYPSLGFNRNWITVGGYMFNIPGNTNVQKSRVWVINKADVYAGLNNINVPFFDRTDYFHIVPAITYDPNDNTNWCVSVHNSNSNDNGFVRLFSITGTAASPVFNLTDVVNVGSSWSSAGVNGPQLNSNTGLDLGDNRIRSAVFRNGVFSFANNIFLPATNPTYCGIQIVSLNPANANVNENIRIFDNTGTSMAAYPSVSINQNNDLFIGYKTFYTNDYASSAVSVRRSGQPVESYVYKPGEDWYVKLDSKNLNRWGDYSATFIDPEDDITAWTIGEYARPRVTGTSHWGTWWAKICPASCTDDFVLSGTNDKLMKKYEANNTITSTAQIQNNSFIKYDAGGKITLSAGFKAAQGTILKAYIDGCGGIR
jgi:hypothetical protein